MGAIVLPYRIVSYRTVLVLVIEKSEYVDNFFLDDERRDNNQNNDAERTLANLLVDRVEIIHDSLPPIMRIISTSL